MMEHTYAAVALLVTSLVTPWAVLGGWPTAILRTTPQLATQPLQSTQQTAPTTPTNKIESGGDEGIWTFDHFPAARVEKAYGVKINQAWHDRVQANSVPITNSCSAALVHFRSTGKSLR